MGISALCPWEKAHPRPARWGQGGRGAAAHPSLHSVFALCSLEMLDPMFGHPTAWRGERSSFPSSQHAVATIPHSEGVKMYLQGHVCTTHHWDLGTAQSLGSLQGFFPCLPGKQFRAEAVLERSCHQRCHRMGWQSSSGRDTAGAREDARRSQGSWQRPGRAAATPWPLQWALEQRGRG